MKSVQSGYKAEILSNCMQWCKHPGLLTRALSVDTVSGDMSVYHTLWKFICPLQALLLLLSRFSRVQLCVTPEMAAHQAPPSLGFSRQEHWSGLPFPSPMHESEKWKVKSLSHVRLLATPWTAGYQAPPSMGFPRHEYWSGLPLPSQGYSAGWVQMRN